MDDKTLLDRLDQWEVRVSESETTRRVGWGVDGQRYSQTVWISGEAEVDAEGRCWVGEKGVDELAGVHTEIERLQARHEHDVQQHQADVRAMKLLVETISQRAVDQYEHWTALATQLAERMNQG